MMLVKHSQAPWISRSKYSVVFIQLDKPVACDIKHKMELLDPKKPIPCHKQQKINERELQEVQKELARIIIKRLDAAQYILI